MTESLPVKSKTFIVSVMALMLTIITSIVLVTNSFSSVRSDVEALKEGQKKFYQIDEIVRSNQVLLSRITANQNNIIKLLDRHDNRMSDLEKECRK